MRRSEPTRRTRSRLLPDSVCIGVDAVASQLWGERGTPEQVRQRIKARLATLSAKAAKVWQLDVDWSVHVLDLHQALAVSAPLRTASDERKQHAAIAELLNGAAAALRKPGEADPYIDATLGLLPYLGAPATTWKMPRVDLWAGPRGPKLSELLRAYAAMFDRKHGRVIGLSETQHWGGRTTTKQRGSNPANAAAGQAFDNISTLLRQLTGKPHDDICVELVRAFHPKNTVVDLASAARYRRRAGAKKANGKTRRK